MVGGGGGEDLEDWGGGLLGWGFFLGREGRGWGLGGAMLVMRRGNEEKGINCEKFMRGWYCTDR